MADKQVWRAVDPSVGSADWWARWDSLNAQGCSSHPLLESEFVRLAEAHFADEKVVRAICTWSGREVAMALLRKTSALTWDLFQPSQAPLPFLVFRSGLPDPLTMVSRMIPSWVGLPVRLQFERLDLPYFPLQPTEATNRFEFADKGITFSVSGLPDFAGYWGRRPKGLRHNISRYFRRLESDGVSWRLERAIDPDLMARAVGDYGDLESAGWKGRAGTAVHSSNKQGRFYRELMEHHARRGTATVYRLWFNETLVAVRLVVAGAGTAVFLKTTYDERYGKYAAGRLLLYLVLKDLIGDSRTRRIEFYTNANKDALQWATDQRTMYALTLYRSVVIRIGVNVFGAARRLVRRPARPIYTSTQAVPD